MEKIELIEERPKNEELSVLDLGLQSYRLDGRRMMVVMGSKAVCTPFEVVFFMSAVETLILFLPSFRMQLPSKDSLCTIDSSKGAWSSKSKSVTKSRSRDWRTWFVFFIGDSWERFLPLT